MLILTVEPEKVPEIKEISGSLKEMQSIVGGCIQALYPFEDEVALICNDEGMLLGRTPNRALKDDNGNIYDVICGTFFLCGAPSDSDHFTGLTPEQIEKFEKRFHFPEIFIGTNGSIVCLPLDDPELI